MTPTTDDAREPSAILTSTCDIDEASFADVDRDTVDDLVIRSGANVYLWPSSRGTGEPVVWAWSKDGVPGEIDVSTPNAGPVRVQWTRGYPDGTFEFEVDPVSLQLVDVPDGLDWNGDRHLGDVDGDALADLYAARFPGVLPSVRATRTGVYTEIPGIGPSPTEYEYSPTYVHAVGDVNHDGYDDVLVGQRKRESVDVDCDWPRHSTNARFFGPAQLFLGSATGLQTEPLWSLSAPDHPKAGVGRGVAPLPDERTIVVTVVTEGDCGDLSPELLGVIRDADTPYAWFDRFVHVAEFTPGEDDTPELEGWHTDASGQRALVLIEPGGVLWVPWFADGSGLYPNANGLAVPSSWWRQGDGYDPVLSEPVGGTHQVFHLVDTNTLTTWGRSPTELGIPASGSTIGGCTFGWDLGGTTTGTSGDPEPPFGVTTTDTAPGPSTGTEPSCGCGADAGAPWLAGVVPWFLRRRRQRPNSRSSGTGGAGS